jgi:hypothetical protein
MMFRAIICCAALIFGLLAALSATAQSAGAPQPLNLMSFMRGSAKAGPAGTASAKTASTTKHRHATTKAAARVHRDVAASAVASSEPPVLQAAAATAEAPQSDVQPQSGVQPQSDVQVVSGDELNVIDLAMNSSAAETDGAASRTDREARDRLKSADANESRAEQYQPDSAAAPSNEVAGAGQGAARDDEIAPESWMTRFWSALGDGFVALVGMVRVLFG